MTKFIWQDGDWVDADKARRRATSGLQIIKDIEPYRNIVDGTTIGGRRQHRDFLKATGYEEVGNERTPLKGEHQPKGVPQDIKRAIEELGSR